MNYQLLGENIQTIRKLKKITQQELADAIGINMQSLSKIERGVNFPTFETLEKITKTLDVTPNELLSGKLQSTSHIESDIIDFLKREGRLNVELEHGQYDNPLDEDEWIEYELKKLREYITNYINSDKRTASDLYPIKKFVQHLQFQKLLSRFDDYLCFDLFGETIEGHKNVNPYYSTLKENIIPNKDIGKNTEYLSRIPTIKGFEDLNGIE